MRIISRVVLAVQSLLGALATESNEKRRVVKRRRRFTPETLAQTFVLGHLSRPCASERELAEVAAICGVHVSPQAIEQRFTPELAAFLEELFHRAVQCLVASQESLTPLLARFTGVRIGDSTTITLDGELSDRFPGCGGSFGGGKAAMKIQLEWDLRNGDWSAISVEAGRDCDCKTPLQTAPVPAGTLKIKDLGFFDTEVFERQTREGVYWLSRLQYGTKVLSAEGVPLKLLPWLASQESCPIDQWIKLGAARQVDGRILAWRVPKEVANRRRQKLKDRAKEKSGAAPSAERLAWCDWTILVTNLPVDQLSPQEALVLYRARWQIELLFKRWKSVGRVAELTGRTVVHQMVHLWSRLLAVLLEHWLILSTAWGDLRVSLMKAAQLIRRHAVLIAAHLSNADLLRSTIERLRGLIRKTAIQHKRSRPNTFQLLNDPTLIEYLLT